MRARKTRVAIKRIPTQTNDQCSEGAQNTKVVSETAHLPCTTVGKVLRVEEQGKVIFVPNVSEAKHLASMELNIKLGCLNTGLEQAFSLKQRAPRNEGR